MSSHRAAVWLLLSVCAWGAVPSPESHFGHTMGADRKLLDWSNVVSYFRKLEQASDRIRVEELGKTTLGRPFIAATLASPATLRDLEEYRSVQKRLADPRRTSTSDAEGLVSKGKAVVLITCSIHSTEVASTSTAVQFAYKLLTDDTLKFRAILDNTIFLLVPSLNPDGVDIVADWYRKTLGTPFEGTSPPELYHKYVGHDNNRDWYIFSQVETRLAISRLHNRWHPHIVYDVHQQGAYASRMFVPPWLDPIDPNIDPIIAQFCNAIGAGMAADLTAAGKTGIAINAMYDFWTPSRHYQAYHGGLRILSESASARLATPITVKSEELNQNALGYSPRERSWNHLEPWSGGEWRVRDIVDYQLIAMESLLYQAAVRREDLVRAFYRVNERATARRSPVSFIIPANQEDPGATRVLLETLAFGLVEIEQAADRFSAGNKQYEAGSYIVRMQQPFSSFAKTLLERQQYPDLRIYPGGPPRRPYDVTAHTLPLLMGVRVDTAEQPFDVKTNRVESFARSGSSSSTILNAANTDSWRAVNKAWAEGKTVWRDPASGDFYLNPSAGHVPPRAIKQPRIGLYKSWVPSMDEGWTRWLLEQFGFVYSSVRNTDLQQQDLHRKFDVIVFPDQTAEVIREGYKKGTMPEEFTGGLGEKGGASLKDFVQNGGTLVFLNDSTAYAIQQLGLGVKDALHGVSNREFYAPGSLLNARLEPHPLTLGLPAEIAVWFESGPAFQVTSDSRARAVAHYPETNVLASGWLLGEKHIARRSPLVDVPVGRGHVILFGIRPQYRAQSYQTFKLLFNALVYSAVR